jgi:hypothetical protein
VSTSASDLLTATVVTNTRVREGHSTKFAAWQAQMNEVIAGFDGFLSMEVIPPSPPVQRDWVIIQRFQRPEQLKAWLDSDERVRMVAEIRPVLEGDDAINVFVGKEAAGPVGPVTAVIMTLVKPGHEDAFKAWHDRVKTAQATYPGFLGCEVQAPTGMFQEEWVTLLSFDSQEHLDAWLESDARRRLLREAEEIIERSRERRVRTSFEGWFKFGPDDRPPPSWKQSALVLLVLFPVVMLEIVFLNPVLAWMNVAPGTFVANVISVSVLGFLLMPLAIRAMNWWLHPPPARARAVALRGSALLVALYAIAIVFFYFLAHWVVIHRITSL